MPPRILAFAGSTRRESFNKKILQHAVNGARETGVEVTLIDLKDFPLPLFDQDLETEQGMPENGATLKKLFVDHDGLLIASPEYNSSVTAVMKNTIDWVSRAAAGEPPLVAFTGKVATLMSASPGALGGLRALVHVRSILGNIGVIVLPDQISVPKAHEGIKQDGSLADPKQQAGIEGLGKKLATFLMKLKVQ
jgi:NAD(P)H-dependent FMN reductase